MRSKAFQVLIHWRNCEDFLHYLLRIINLDLFLNNIRQKIISERVTRNIDRRSAHFKLIHLHGEFDNHFDRRSPYERFDDSVENI